MNIYTIGGSGMVGSRFAELLGERHTFDDLSLTTGVDITKPESLAIIQNDTEHEAVIHFAAKADVDGCERDKPLGEAGAAFQINVQGTRNVVEACRATKKKLVYISTDFVFDGKNPPEGGYTEEAIPNPLNWYAQTKYEGEKIVQDSGLPYLIIRIAFPYRKTFEAKKDFVRAIAERLVNKLPVAAVADQHITPTFIDDIVVAVDSLLSQQSTGIFHVVGSESITPYDAALKIAQTFGYDSSLISKTTGDVFFAGRATRPFHLSLNNDKIKHLGIAMRGFTQGLEQVH